MNKISIAVIGAGRIGAFHAKNLASHHKVKVKTIYDVNINSAKNLANELNSNVANNDKEIFEDKEIKAIFICSDTPSHIKYLELSHIYNKHAYCEKIFKKN